MRQIRVLFALVLPAVLATIGNVFAEGHYFEVESISAVSPWELTTEKSGYLGTGYFEWTSGFTSSPQGILQYTFTTQTPGYYWVTLRGRRDQEGICEGLANDMCNDVFSKVDDRSWKKTMIKGTWGQWIWQAKLDQHTSGDDGRVGDPRYYLEAGTHTIQFAGRSRGIKFDAFTVHLEGTVRPEGPTDSNAVPTVMTAPASGEVLEEGKTYTLTAEGENLQWSYDAASDGIGSVAIGSGSSVEFEIPTGVNDPRTITITVAGTGGSVSRTFSIGSGETSARHFLQRLNAPPRQSRAFYSIHGRMLGSVHERMPAGLYLAPEKTGIGSNQLKLHLSR